jgi:hypothetical protein
MIMKHRNRLLAHSLAILLAVALESGAPAASDVDKQRQDVEQQARPELQKEKKDAEEKAEQTLDKEAIAAIDETASAIKAIADNKTDEALAAIERATGKISILLARNPGTALLPVSFQVEIIETAPVSLDAIKARAKAAEAAVDDKVYPAARVLLDGLTSEIRLRTINLPLASYPVALKDAARLLDEKRSKEANTVLLTALRTLAVIDVVTPLPLALAKAAINEAQSSRDKDKEAAQKQLATARNELERARELGYSGKDGAYAVLSKDIQDIEKQLKGNENTDSLFASLKEKIGALFKRQSESKQPSSESKQL